jgi:hypothetical protein
MKTVINILIKLLGDKLAKTIIVVCEALKSFFSYKKTVTIKKIEEKKQEKTEEFNKKIDDIVDKGTLEDLLNLDRK